MSERFIPEQIELYRFAEQNLAIDGRVKVADMHRLSTAVLSSDDIVSAHLEFGIDEQGITFLKGKVEATLTLECQRCMEPFSYEIISNFVLGIVNTPEAVNNLPDHYEPALASDGLLALRELIEDELILNLPIIPKHEADSCKVQLPMSDSGWEKAKADNPFHVLKGLKDKK